MKRGGPFMLLVALVVALAGCGSSSSHTSGGSASGGSGSASSGEAAKPAKQIVADAATALRGARGYVIDVQGTQNGRSVSFSIKRDAAGAVSLGESIGPSAAQIVLLPNAAYLRANQAFYKAQGAPPQLVPDRWLEIPATAISSLTSQLGQFAPTRLGTCMASEHGTLTKAGTATVNGQSAVLIKDAGDLPGTQPGILAVGTSSPYYPLQLRITGHRRPGGKLGPCNNGTSAGILGTLTLSDFNQVPAITPPAHATKLG